MKLLLTSSGFATPALEAELLGLLGKAKGTFRSVFVPTAADPEPNKEFVESARSELRALSASVNELDLKSAEEPDIERALSDADLVMVNGGNTFYLLYHANRSGFARPLKKFLSRGGVYVGVSAGSILASPTIAVAGFKGYDDPRVVELPSLQALGLIDSHLFVHDAPQWDDLVLRESSGLSGPLIRLRDGEAVSISDADHRIIRLT